MIFYQGKALIRIKAYPGTLLQKFLYFQKQFIDLFTCEGALLISLKLKEMLFIQVSCYNA
ncbi:hypothetical protein BM1374166_00738 [Bartonella tribocorum]|nr:hypothetical protein BM1374166_00738 [Bartonella tribocorum]